MKRILRYSIYFGLLILSVLLVALGITLVGRSAGGPGEGPGEYVGYKVCGDCHAETMNLWLRTSHAHALETLAAEGRERNLTCIPCHTTGFGDPYGFLDPEITPEFGGVQCEECHGPGKEHVSSFLAKQMQRSRPGADACRKCHTIEQDSDFNYERMSQMVHHSVAGPPDKSSPDPEKRNN